MPVIFVSYRRTDVPGHAGRLYDRLVDRFGRGDVFKDVDSMDPGVDFVEVIERTIERCDAVIAVIGREWLGRLPNGEHRLDDPADWVHVEIGSALERGVRVIPILVEGASMPPVTELPEPLRRLARRHAVELSETAWSAQVDQLLNQIETALEPLATEQRRSRAPRAEDSSDTWTAQLRSSTDRDRTLALRRGASIHTLFLHAGVWADKVTLDGHKLPREDPGGVRESLTLSEYAFKLAHDAGVSNGVVRYGSRVAGPVTWVTVDIDEVRVFEDGNPVS